MTGQGTAAAGVARAESLLDVGRPTEAILALNSVLAQHPEDTGALCLLSRALLAAGRGLEAVQAASRAATNDPGDLQARLDLVNALVGIGHSQGSAEQARIVLAMAPQSSTALYGAAYGLSSGASTLREAEPVIDRAIVLDPNDADAHNLRAVILWGLGRRREALDSVAQALTLNPQDPHALANQARFSAARGRFGQSLRAAASGVRSNPAGRLSTGAFRDVITEMLRRLGWILALGVVATAATVTGTPGWVRVAVAGLALALAVAYVGWIVRAAPKESLPMLKRTLLRPWRIDRWLTVVLAVSLALVMSMALAPLDVAAVIAAFLVMAIVKLGFFVVAFLVVRWAGRSLRRARRT